MAEGYFEHEADIGIIGKGKTVEDAFVSAAQSTFAIMTDLTTVKTTQTFTVEFEESDIELALVIWLNKLINLSRQMGIIFSRFQLKKENNFWKGKAWGEPWQKNLIHGTEVKGATLTMLSVKKISTNVWEARCVVDV